MRVCVFVDGCEVGRLKICVCVCARARAPRFHLVCINKHANVYMTMDTQDSNTCIDTEAYAGCMNVHA